MFKSDNGEFMSQINLSLESLEKKTDFYFLENRLTIIENKKKD